MMINHFETATARDFKNEYRGKLEKSLDYYGLSSEASGCWTIDQPFLHISRLSIQITPVYILLVLTILKLMKTLKG